MAISVVCMGAATGQQQRMTISITYFISYETEILFSLAIFSRDVRET